MTEKDRGLVLGRTPYNATTLIADVFLSRYGRTPFLVRLGKKKGGRMAVPRSLFFPLSLVELTWEHRPGATFQRPASAEPLVPIVSLPYEPAKAAIALFLADFLSHALKAETDTRPLFSYMERSVEWLDACPKGYANFHLVFLLHFSRFLGFFPNLDQAKPGAWFDLLDGRYTEERPPHPHAIAPEEACRLPLLMRMRYDTMHRFRFTGAERTRLLMVINEYYRLHLPAFPELRSLAVLAEVFGAKPGTNAPQERTLPVEPTP